VVTSNAVASPPDALIQSMVRCRWRSCSQCVTAPVRGRGSARRLALRRPGDITETNRIRWALFGMQNRTLDSLFGS
jgi:hypothetical protein